MNKITNLVSKYISKREFTADIALISSGWSKQAASAMWGAQNSSGGTAPDRYLREYVGWGKYLANSNNQWDVVIAEDMTLTDLQKFKKVILPSTLSLTQGQADMLKAYVDGGGKLVITGDAGMYQGPDGYLMPWSTNILTTLKGYPTDKVHVNSGKPGLAYEGDPSSTNAQGLTDLLNFTGVTPSVTTTAPTTVGVSLSHSLVNANQWSLDLVNYNLSPDLFTITSTGDFTVTVTLPALQNKSGVLMKNIQAVDTATGLQNFTNFTYNSATGTLTVTVPSFDYYQLMVIDAY